VNAYKPIDASLRESPPRLPYVAALNSPNGHLVARLESRWRHAPKSARFLLPIDFPTTGKLSEAESTRIRWEIRWEDVVSTLVFETHNRKFVASAVPIEDVVVECVRSYVKTLLADSSVQLADFNKHLRIGSGDHSWTLTLEHLALGGHSADLGPDSAYRHEMIERLSPLLEFNFAFFDSANTCMVQLAPRYVSRNTRVFYLMIDCWRIAAGGPAIE
jgi:hypothetical protein